MNNELITLFLSGLKLFGGELKFVKLVSIINLRLNVVIIT